MGAEVGFCFLHNIRYAPFFYKEVEAAAGFSKQAGDIA